MTVGTSWRTTLFALLAVLPQLLQLIPNINPIIPTAVSMVFVALGLNAAKDKQVTGGTIVNQINDASAVAASSQTSVAEGVPVATTVQPPSRA